MSSKIAFIFILVTFSILAGSNAAAQRSARTYVFDRMGERGRLGVSVEDVTPKLKERKHLSVDEGAYVKDVVEDSPAEKAGIQEGDVIVKFNDRTIEDSDDLIRATERTKARTDVKIEVVRSKDHKTLTATLERVRAPRAFSFNFDNLHVPNLPKMPHHFQMFSSDRLGGLTVQDLTKQLAAYFQVPDRRGLLVTDVENGSDAEKANFKAGDVITKVNNSSVRDVEELRSELEDFEGKDAAVEIIRSGKTLSLTLHLERDDDDDDDSSLLIAPDRCFPHNASTGSATSEFHQRVLDRMMKSLRNLEARIENRINSVVNRIRATFTNSSENGDRAAEARG